MGKLIIAIAMLIALTWLTGCTVIRELNVITVAAGCDIQRGQNRATQTDVKADVVTRSGTLGTALVESLRSHIDCPDGSIVGSIETNEQSK